MIWTKSPYLSHDSKVVPIPVQIWSRILTAAVDAQRKKSLSTRQNFE